MRWRAGLWCLTTMMGCSSGTAYYPAPHPVDPHRPVQTVYEEIPPQTFVAPPHQPRAYPRPVPAAIGSLPPLRTSSKCVDAGAVPEGRPGAAVAKRTTPPPKDARRDVVPYAGEAKSAASGASSDAPARAPAPTDAAPMPAAPAAEPAGESEYQGGDAVDADDAVAPMAPMESMGPDRTTTRQRREDRRARRQASKSEAWAPQTAPRPPEPVVEVIEAERPPPEQGWGEATFLSNDDTMSMSSPQRVRHALEHGLPLPRQHIRPHELLNAATFDIPTAQPGHDFSVDAQLAPSRRDPGLHTLALGLRSRTVGKAGRRNAVITYVVDRSGSMRAEGRMEYLKRGLLRSLRELKHGDIVHLVSFDHRVCVPLQNFVVGRDDTSTLTKAIMGLRPSGYTNVHAGLTQGYRLADASYQPQYTNRVVLVTDALANRGTTDPATLAMVSDFYDARRIRLSGIGVGREFDDALLDALTEKGRGAYVFLGSETEVDRIFGHQFTSLIETIANDVHVRLHLPLTMRLHAFHGEEASAHKADVQAVHFFADTDQVLLADLEAWQGRVRREDGIMVEIDYQHPDTGERLTEAYAFDVGQMLARDTNVRKAEVMMHFAQSLHDVVLRFGAGPFGRNRHETPVDNPRAARLCQSTARDLARLATGQTDPEVHETLALWDRFCGRFGAASIHHRPPRKTD